MADIRMVYGVRVRVRIPLRTGLGQEFKPWLLEAVKWLPRSMLTGSPTAPHTILPLAYNGWPFLKHMPAAMESQWRTILARKRGWSPVVGKYGRTTALSNAHLVEVCACHEITINVEYTPPRNAQPCSSIGYCPGSCNSLMVSTWMGYNAPLPKCNDKPATVIWAIKLWVWRSLKSLRQKTYARLRIKRRFRNKSSKPWLVKSTKIKMEAKNTSSDPTKKIRMIIRRWHSTPSHLYLTFLHPALCHFNSNWFTLLRLYFPLFKGSFRHPIKNGNKQKMRLKAWD